MLFFIQFLVLVSRQAKNCNKETPCCVTVDVSGVLQPEKQVIAVSVMGYLVALKMLFPASAFYLA